mmetsp:Transcript_37461/g.117853  ORF Transcript_37461/g.117853 Transcript_37461/m.117853 type:complete len:206 (-) Transcript_37461:138-755(-)
MARGRARALPRGHAGRRGFPRPGEVPPTVLWRRRPGHRADPQAARVHVVRDDARDRRLRGVPRSGRLVQPQRARPRLPEAEAHLRARGHRVGPARPQADRPGGVQSHADQGAPERPPGYARSCRLHGSGGGHRRHVGRLLGARVWRGRRGLLAELSSTAHDGEGCPQFRPSQREELPSCVSPSMFWSFCMRALLVREPPRPSPAA